VPGTQGQTAARPGGKDLLGKNHVDETRPREAAHIPWTGRANRSNPTMKVFPPCRGDRTSASSVEPPVARSARRILRETKRSLQEKGQPGRCFLPRSPLPPGHDPGHPEVLIPPRAEPPAGPGGYPRKLLQFFWDTAPGRKSAIWPWRPACAPLRQGRCLQRRGRQKMGAVAKRRR
jgi:hypothetical protein